MSLFAFQDVMASVIGVIFFIVLLIALNIVEEPPRDGTQGATADVEEVRRRARSLAKEAEQLRRRLSELEQASATVPNAARTAAEVRSLHRTLSSLHEAVRREQTTRNEVDDRLAQAEAAQASSAERLAELEAALRTLAEQARAGPRIAYILDSGPGTPTPWLVELSSDRIRAASSDGAAAVFSFGGSSLEVRRERLLVWAARQERSTSYFVLLIKPSAVAWAYDVANDLHKAGFRFGTELLPESWEAFE